MDKFIVEGGIPLRGEVSASGSKNAALPIIAAALMADGPSVIRNVPRLRDTATMVRILAHMGAATRFENGTLEIDPRGIDTFTAPYEFVSTMRASVCLLGPLLAKFGTARFSMPGGCVIGSRPIDLHIKGLRKLGIEITVEEGDVVGSVSALKGARVFLGGNFGSSVLATANVMSAACLAKGTTSIEFAACEPEIVDLTRFLTAMGARIRGENCHLVEIEGVGSLHGAEYAVMPDRIEAGTYLLAGAATGGDVRVTGCPPETLLALADKLEEAGVRVTAGPDWIAAAANGRPKATDIVTLPFPGFPTDLQAQMMAFLTTADGISVVTEKVFPERFIHVGELNRLGAAITLDGSRAVVRGVERLRGARTMASDLRASAALVVAGVAAEGVTQISRIYHLDRGYENFERKLGALGARIERAAE